MEKAQLKKNKLDLEFHWESQKVNAFLILLTIGILAFLGTFLWLAENRLFYYGVIITFISSIIGVFFYKKSANKMKEILNEIINL